MSRQPDIAISLSTSGLSAANPIEASAIGAEFLGWEGFSGFVQRYENVGFTHLRWPGGIPVEDGIDITGDGVRDVVFDLGNDNLVDWRRWNDEADKADGIPEGAQREGLREILAFASSNGLSLSIVLPTARYVQMAIDDSLSSAIETISQDVAPFLTRLLSGYYGNVPDKLVLEIGSEYYATETWRNNNAIGTDNADGTSSVSNADLPDLFAQISAAMTLDIRTVVDAMAAASTNSEGVTPIVAVQAGRFQSGADMGHVDGQPSDDAVFRQVFVSTTAIDAVDAIIWHRYSPDFTSAGYGVTSPLNGTDIASVMAQWEAAAGRDLALVGGWLSPDAQAPDRIEFGGPSLSGILQAFSGLVDAGMEIGSVYGLGLSTPGSLGSQGTTYVGGQLIGLMAQSLVGTRVRDAYEANTAPSANGQLVVDDTINKFVFESGEKVVIFLHAKDFSGDALSRLVAIDGWFSAMSVTRLSLPEGEATLDLGEIGLVGLIEDDTPAQMIRTPEGTLFDLVFESDYELIRVELVKDAAYDFSNVDTIAAGGGTGAIYGTSDDDMLMGSLESNSVFGGAGVDTFILSGDAAARVSLLTSSWQDTGQGRDQLVSIENLISGDGNDYLFGSFGDNRIAGGGGADQIFGAAGNDTLEGDVGDDMINGGSGNDILRGGSGADVLLGSSGCDILDGGADYDLLYGGADADIFLFRKGSGSDVIADFRPVIEGDRIHLDAAMTGGSTEFSDLQDHVTESSEGLLIDFGDGDSILLRGFSQALSEDMFAWL